MPTRAEKLDRINRERVVQAGEIQTYTDIRTQLASHKGARKRLSEDASPDEIRFAELTDAILAKPTDQITDEDARQLQSAETKAVMDPGRTSLAAAMQRVAAMNAKKQ